MAKDQYQYQNEAWYDEITRIASEHPDSPALPILKTVWRVSVEHDDLLGGSWTEKADPEILVDYQKARAFFPVSTEKTIILERILNPLRQQQKSPLARLLED